MLMPSASGSTVRLLLLLGVCTLLFRNYFRRMDRLTDETEYVLIILHEMRDRVIAEPQLFDPLALERIDGAIALIQVTKRC